MIAVTQRGNPEYTGPVPGREVDSRERGVGVGQFQNRRDQQIPFHGNEVRGYRIHSPPFKAGTDHSLATGHHLGVVIHAHRPLPGDGVRRTMQLQGSSRELIGTDGQRIGPQREGQRRIDTSGPLQGTADYVGLHLSQGNIQRRRLAGRLQRVERSSQLQPGVEETTKIVPRSGVPAEAESLDN